MLFTLISFGSFGIDKSGRINRFATAAPANIDVNTTLARNTNRDCILLFKLSIEYYYKQHGTQTQQQGHTHTRNQRLNVDWSTVVADFCIVGIAFLSPRYKFSCWIIVFSNSHHSTRFFSDLSNRNCSARVLAGLLQFRGRL